MTLPNNYRRSIIMYELDDILNHLRKPDLLRLADKLNEQIPNNTRKPKIVKELSEHPYDVVVDQLRVADLKRVLQQVGKNTTGNKTVLVNRVLDLLDGVNSSEESEEISEETTHYLYAIKLRKNSRDIFLYVGLSNWHTPKCKFNIHTEGSCICFRKQKNVKQYQRAPFPRKYGTKLFDSKVYPQTVTKTQEEKWAKQLARKHQRGVWCNGKLFK